MSSTSAKPLSFSAQPMPSSLRSGAYCLHFFTQHPRLAILLAIIANIGIFLVFIQNEPRQVNGKFGDTRVLPRWINPDATSVVDSSQQDECAEYRYLASMERRRALDILENTEHIRNYEQDSITLITHMSADRIDRFRVILKHWTGPVAATVQASQEETEQLLHDIRTDVDLVSRRNLQLHIVEKNGDIYPVNYLRNVGRNASVTEYVFSVDVDLVPSPGSHDVLHHYVKSMSQNQVAIVPAFQEASQESNIRNAFPKTKRDLIDLWDKEHIIPFLAGPGECTKCHKSTQFAVWKNTTEAYEISYKRYFEPYLVGRRAQLPSFSQLYAGRYKDKISFVEEVYAMGLNFFVVSDVFLLHLWHEHSNQFNLIWKRCSNDAELTFETYLKEKYEQFQPWW